MAKREIITIPDPLLRQVSQPVERVDDDLRRLMDDMLETMYAAPGIGLAGVQVAVPRRVIVMDPTQKDTEAEEDAAGGETATPGPERNPVVMVNPEIVQASDDMRAHEEGCLSIPDFYAEVERPARCTVRYLDRDGRPQEMTCDGVFATVVQHEIDHLDGVLFIDYLSRLKRDRVIKKFVKARKAEETV